MRKNKFHGILVNHIKCRRQSHLKIFDYKFLKKLSNLISSEIIHFSNESFFVQNNNASTFVRLTNNNISACCELASPYNSEISCFENILEKIFKRAKIMKLIIIYAWSLIIQKFCKINVIMYI